VTADKALCTSHRPVIAKIEKAKAARIEPIRAARIGPGY